LEVPARGAACRSSVLAGDGVFPRVFAVRAEGSCFEGLVDRPVELSTPAGRDFATSLVDNVVRVAPSVLTACLHGLLCVIMRAVLLRVVFLRNGPRDGALGRRPLIMAAARTATLVAACSKRLGDRFGLGLGLRCASTRLGTRRAALSLRDFLPRAGCVLACRVRAHVRHFRVLQQCRRSREEANGCDGAMQHVRSRKSRRLRAYRCGETTKHMVMIGGC
jgi:hypothetical protein